MDKTQVSDLEPGDILVFSTYEQYLTAHKKFLEDNIKHKRVSGNDFRIVILERTE